ncbi:MAG TPA: hypothetical protein VK176_11925 [Phycisphaerales bacterium]|nr:hypothetical protein [Phycisphaerales bacterium]
MLGILANTVTSSTGASTGDTLSRVISDRQNLETILIVGGIVFVIAMIVIARTIRAIARERTKREIAAYIAEGSMTPEQGDRLLKSGIKDREC